VTSLWIVVKVPEVMIACNRNSVLEVDFVSVVALRVMTSLPKPTKNIMN
jgi:hypothetical protein